MAENQTITAARQEMIVYCKHLPDIISSLSTPTSGDDGNKLMCQEKCSSLCKHISGYSSEMMTEAAVHECLQAIAKLVLDLTFMEEKILIDEDFSSKSSFYRVCNIIDTLQSVVDLANRTVQDKPVADVLSSEIMECLQWRKGALLYMYCHTINTQFSSESLPFYFSQCLEDGIKYLTSVFCTGSPPKWLTGAMLKKAEIDSEEEAEDKAGMLLAQGILSDTHLLALMYCGELCYWHTKLHRPNVHKHENKTKSDQSLNDAFDVSSVERNFSKDCSQINKSPSSHDSLVARESLKFGSSCAFYPVSEKCLTSPLSIAAQSTETKIDIVKIGKLCLENYVSAAHGPLVIGGWKTTKAEEILQYLYNLK
ncbi:unnamed protein product [Candidula unifasciata]|uniref:Uncharacterized protein n=1 Tax=Candidula unifasciata TaxID=100452 RepID=A0A8S3YSY7_9EUPU|nr:unnamed protein product [Candidula unifasciata]